MPSGDNTAKQDKVRELQVKLYLAAKRSPGSRRFHALWECIHCRDVLQRAWGQVRENRGSAGVDRITISQIEESGVEAFLTSSSGAQSGALSPGPGATGVYPEARALQQRPLGIPRIKDRVAQTAAKLVGLEPIFEADFRDCSFGFRPKRSAHDALDAIKREVMRGRHWVIDADIRGFFDALDPQILEQLVCDAGLDRRVLRSAELAGAGCSKGVKSLSSRGRFAARLAPISPLLANVYLNALDRAWEDRHGELGVLVRYCDDLVIVCRTRAQAEAALRELRALLAELHLQLAEAKTRLVCLDNDGEGFDFLGFTTPWWRASASRGFATWRAGRRRPPCRRRGARIRGLTERRLLLLPLEDVVANLNRFLTGWAGYFRRGNSTTQFHKLTSHTASGWPLDRDAPPGQASARLRLLAAAPGALLRSATTRRTRPRCRAPAR